MSLSWDAFVYSNENLLQWAYALNKIMLDVSSRITLLSKSYQ